MQHLTEDQFFEIYKPISKKDGTLVLEKYETLDVDLHNVWTLVDGDNGGSFAIPGYHLVNRFGYVITEERWDTDEIEAVWQEPDEEEDDEDDEDYEFFGHEDSFGGE